MPGIIKSGSPEAGQQLKNDSPIFRFQDFEQKALQYSQKVYEEGQEIIAKAKAEAEEIRRKTKEDARQEAMDQVRQEFRSQQQAQLATISPMVQSAVAQLQDNVKQFQLDWESKTVSLAIGIAQKIIRRQLQDQPEIVLDQIQSSLRLSGNQDEISLHVNPSDQEQLSVSIESLLNQMGLITKTKIVPDPLVGSGGCVVRTSYGQIDGQIETQLQRIEEELAQ